MFLFFCFVLNCEDNSTPIQAKNDSDDAMFFVAETNCKIIYFLEFKIWPIWSETSFWAS